MHKYKLIRGPVIVLRLALLTAACLAWALVAATNPGGDPLHPEAGGHWITADHSKFEVLKQEFTSGPQVTRACLSCHTEAAGQFMKTIHWTWLCPKAPKDSQLGKAGLVVNNFCVAVPSNYPRCTSCHAGYGFKDKNFDFNDQSKVDCLVCHEQTGTYKKFPAGAGNPVSEPTVFPGNGKTYLPPEWNKVAQSVARPSRKNCGTCHFFGGGGDGVKHGDLDSSMTNPDKKLDVHMDVKGLNFDCSRCHTTTVHKISGRCYKTPAAEERVSLLKDDQTSRITCVACHSDKPHEAGHKANDHTDKVACQTCHIPAFARKLPTKMYWDWSTSGKKRDGEKKIMKEVAGVKRPVFDMIKGDFVWEANVVPEYKWFNGSIENVMAYTKIDPKKPVVLTEVKGDPEDGKSFIYPFKVHRGKQPYDAGNDTMVIPHLFGKDDTAFWGNFDWNKAVKAGMEYVGLPYSGELGWVETEYVYPITHQVAPKEAAVSCNECHSRDKSRLAGIQGVYMPGRDHAGWLDFAGWGLALAALIGVFIHGLARMVMKKKN